MTNHSENTKSATCDNNVLANRLLKFRAFDEVRKELFYLPVKSGENRNWLQIDKTGLSVCNNNQFVESFELMDFTGFENKEKIEIYESDILEFVNTDGKILIGNVKWNQKRGCYEIISRYNGKIYDRIWLDQTKAYFSKVIGNVYQNPELLTQTTS